MPGRRAGAVRDKSGRSLGTRAQKTRQKFLEATAKLLAERSILEISVTEIAREVDSVSSLFYHYFESVEDAARDLALEAAGEMPALVEMIDGDWSGDAGLRRARELSRAYLEHWERHRGVLLLRNQASDRGDRRFMAIRRAALEPLIDKLAELVGAAQARGDVAADLHPHLAASALVSLLEQLSAHARSVRHFRATRDDLVDTCARMVYTTVTGK